MQCNKWDSMSYVGNKGSDWTVHLHSPIRAFIACVHNQWIPQYILINTEGLLYGLRDWSEGPDQIPLLYAYNQWLP